MTKTQTEVLQISPLEEPVGSSVILLQSVRTLAIKEGRGAESIGRTTLARCLQEDGLWDG